MAQAHLTPQVARTEEAITVLFCFLGDAYYRFNPNGGDTLLSSGTWTLRAWPSRSSSRASGRTESERSFLQDARAGSLCTSGFRAVGLVSVLTASPVT